MCQTCIYTQDPLLAYMQAAYLRPHLAPPSRVAQNCRYCILMDWKLLLIAILAILASACFKIRSKWPVPSGVFQIPAFPILGHTLLLVHNPSLRLTLWAKSYNQKSFLIRLGNTPVVAVASYSLIRKFWLQHSNALNSRPVLYTFHRLVSQTQGYTVGLTPFGASFLAMKKAILSSLHARRLELGFPVQVVDEVSSHVLEHIEEIVQSTCIDSRRRLAATDIDLLRHLQYYSLGCALKLTYGRKLEPYGVDHELSNTIIETENAIVRTRSLLLNFQDYLPMLLVWPWRLLAKRKSAQYREIRDCYMSKFLAEFQTSIRENDPGAASSLMANFQQHSQLSQAEMASICLTMVSAGLDNTAFTLNYLFGVLSKATNGYTMQRKLYQSLMDSAGQNPEVAWAMAVHGMPCDYAVALIREALRCFTVLPLGLPRATSKSIVHEEVRIPKHTVMIMNAYEANHDASVFPDPYMFIPERWLKNGIINKEAPHHLTFGLGARKCSGDILAMKEMYVFLCRVVLRFEIRRPTNTAQAMVADPFVSNSCPGGTSFEPRPFSVWLRPRVTIA